MKFFWCGQLIETFSAKIVTLVILFQYSTKLKLGISFFNFNKHLTAPSSKRINSNTVTKTLITELDILRFNQRFFACLRGISCDFP